MSASSSASAASNRLLQYRVTHSIYGEIGTYTNRIDQQDDNVVVHTEIHLRVSVLGIVLHREDAEHTENWRDDRLVAFHGITTVNGKAAEVRGDARGEDFEIISPQGVALAPASVRPSNPWSSRILHSGALMLTDSGIIEQVEVGPPKRMVMTIDGAAIATREYEISAVPAYKIWLDEHDIPVRFTVDDESGLITFTLSDS
jgi:hypothetical protein